MACGNRDQEGEFAQDRKMVKWEELKRGHLLKQVRLLDVELKDVHHWHITLAVQRER